MSASRSARWVGGSLVFLFVLARALMLFEPALLILTPDVKEHVSIANAFTLGQGFVNPIQWYFALPGPPPIPAAATRAPVVPLLLTGAFSTGANLAQAMYAHIVLAGFVAIGMFLITCRFTRPPLAAAAVLLIVTTSSWTVVTNTALTEITGLAVSMLVIATAAGVGRSWSGAILCAVVTVLAWLTRPNLAPLGLAVAVAVAWDVRRPSAFIRSPVPVYLVTVISSMSLVSWLITAGTGLPPYDGYRHAFEHFPEARAFRYGLEYVGAATFIEAHFDKIVAACLANARSLSATLFESGQFQFAGWWLLAGTISVLSAPSRSTVEQRILVLGGLGFSTMIVLSYPTFDRLRYPLFPATFGILAGAGALEQAITWCEKRLPAFQPDMLNHGAWACVLAPSVWVLLTLPSLPPTIASPNKSRSVDCSLFEPGTLIMSDEPWRVHWMCGNPAVRVPSNFPSEEVRLRFLADYAPRYFITYRKVLTSRAKEDPELRFLGPFGIGFAFEFTNAPLAKKPGLIVRPPRCRLTPSAPGCEDPPPAEP